MPSVSFRLLLACYALYWVGRYWFWWQTANQPARKSGSLGNPFNDAAHFCDCIYSAAPCPINAVCLHSDGNNDRVYMPRLDHRAFVPWLCHVGALFLLVASNDPAAVLGAFIAMLVGHYT